jgi:hypothetical protein
VPPGRLEAQICSLAGYLAASTHEWPVLIAEFRSAKGLGAKGCQVLRALAVQPVDPDRIGRGRRGERFSLAGSVS